MQHTRRQIIEYLQKYRLGTSIQMGHALQVTSANIRHHINILLDQGLIEIVAQEPGRGRGRPTMIYGLTSAALDNNLEGLIGALLSTLLAEDAPEDHEAEIERLADSLHGEKDIPKSGMREQLEYSISKLNDLHYKSRWEASSEGPRLILDQCPYNSIIDDHPILCQMDAALISKLMGQLVTQIAKLERGPKGVPHCIFILQ